jgi:hypothetical protein
MLSKLKKGYLLMIDLLLWISVIASYHIGKAPLLYQMKK